MLRDSPGGFDDLFAAGLPVPQLSFRYSILQGVVCHC